MALGSIPATKIWQRAMQLEDDDPEMFEDVILAVDKCYMHIANAEKEQKSGIIEKYLKGTL